MASPSNSTKPSPIFSPRPSLPCSTNPFKKALFPPPSLDLFSPLSSKKKGEESDLKNWRPIALLNYDRKILSKILATRIQKVAHSIIHPSQTGFIKGRRIQDNTMALYQILDFYRHSPSPGSLIFLDQEKAYDKVNWEYLLACLSRFGFSPKIRTAIQALYSGLLTSITTNGFMGILFTIAQ